MRNLLVSVAAMIAALFVFNSDLFAGGHGGGGGGGGRGGGPPKGGRIWPGAPGAEQKEKMSVIQITGMDGKVTFETLPDKEVAQREQELADFYGLAKENYKEAKKKAEGSTAIFSEKEPKKPKMVVLKSGMDEESATSYMDKYSEAYYKAHPKEKPGDEKSDGSNSGSGSGASGDENKSSGGTPGNPGNPGWGGGFKGAPGNAEKNKKYSAVKIITHEGVLSFEAIQDEDVKAREEELAELYKVAVDGWKEAKKEAEKENKPFTDKEPPKPEISVIKGGLTKESAEKYCDEYKSAYEKNHPVEEKSKDEKDKAEKTAEKKGADTGGGEKANPEPKPEQPKAE